MTIAERWVRDARGLKGEGPALIKERGGWTVYLTDGKERITFEDYEAFKEQVRLEKMKPAPALSDEAMWGRI